ncbi:hypothetical protein GK047_12840 [Paenibacillus sp. SYP-B3998]|uniref:Uncharacterized protein n=1 Tax=Paenibacillus sp. SYP-B3998 TaxID=2678564 RepID=A0A6G3ZZ82_9BACL|nr:hypothetical protein [Paenibacillus sp. SYP-B3998]NEW06889.1 hypothetical protein [Paenibacillus sp. SYP-B3998]
MWRYAACANEWALLANFVPTGEPLLMSSNLRQARYTTSQELLWGVFDITLKMSQVAVSQLTDEEKAKVEKFRNLLSVKKEKVNLVTDEKKEVIEDGPVLVAYKEKLRAYLEASMKYKHAEIAFNNAESPDAVNTWRFMADELRQSVRSAFDDWVTNGYKNDVEAMVAYINQVTERDMATIKANIEDKFRKAKQAGPNGDFYYSSVIPGDFTRSGGWTGFNFSESSYSHYTSQESTAWGGSASFGFGLWSAGANVSSETKKSFESFDGSGFSMKFEITQVPIGRGWFDPGFMIGKGWKWSKDYIGKDLSDGKEPPSGRLVAYPTTALFVRNVVINNNSFHSDRSTYESQLSSGGSFGWGPFSIGGHYSHSEANERSAWHFEEDGLHIDGLQLIGFICRFLGKAPDPSPNAHFDS